MPTRIPFSDLGNADLIVDAIYEGGTNNNISDEPISKILNCGNAGGFRPVGGIVDQTVKYMVLTSSLAEEDWPDRIDTETGIFTYFGDNRDSGEDLHHPKGNQFLKDIFECLHVGDRKNIPPIFVFTKAPGGYNQQFRGLAVPGVEVMTENEDLVAAWRSKKDNRFLNYRAKFTILNVAKVKREWLRAITDGTPLKSAPEAWVDWMKNATYRALKYPEASSSQANNEHI